jgi:hypothetical protein
MYSSGQVDGWYGGDRDVRLLGTGPAAAGTAPLADEHAVEMIIMAAAESAAIQELRVFMRASVNSRSRNPGRNVAMRTPRGMGLAGYLRIGDCPLR